MKKFSLVTLIIVAFLISCKKETTKPPIKPTKPSATPSVPNPEFTPGLTTINPDQSPDNVDSIVSLASNVSNSVISILTTIGDSLKFDLLFEPNLSSTKQLKTFGTEERYVFTWDTMGLTYKLILILSQNSIIESLFVNGKYRDTGHEINFDNYLFLDLVFNYVTANSDTFGDGEINFYINRDSLDSNWDNSDICFNAFWTFYVRQDTVNYSFFVDTLHKKGEAHNRDFNFFEVFGARKTNFVRAGFSFFQWILYHVKDYLNNSWDEIDLVYNPGAEPTAFFYTHFFPKNTYEIIPKMKKVLKLIKLKNKEIKKLLNYNGWYYKLRFEINPNYRQSTDTARIFYDTVQDSEYPTYPNGPFTVPPFDFGYNW
ncbi:MAG: hypothetical protein ABDH37_08260 [Candidatus Hydrothermales bacterium]